MTPVRICMLAAAILVGCNSRKPPDVEFRLDVARPTLAPGETLDAQITLANRSNEVFLVCQENWSMPTGLIRLHVFRLDGREAMSRESAHYDYIVSEKENLAAIDPGKVARGNLTIDVRRIFGLDEREYDVEAEYFCPFDGTRSVAGRQVRIVGKAMRSNRVRIRLTPH